MKKTLIALSGILANVPGLVMISKHIYLIPGETREFYTGVQTAFCGFILLILILLTGRIASLSMSKVIKVAIALFISFVLVLGSYMFLFGKFVFGYDNFSDCYPEHKEAFLFPFVPSKELKNVLDLYQGDRKNMICGLHTRAPGAFDSSADELSTTRITFMLIYVTSMGLLTAAFALAGIYLTELKKNNRPDQPGPGG